MAGERQRIKDDEDDGAAAQAAAGRKRPTDGLGLLALVLGLGVVVIVTVLLVLDATISRERDHTRSVLVVQQVGRKLSNTSIALRDALVAQRAVVTNAADIEGEIREARAILHEATGAPAGAGGLGRVDDAGLRERMRALDREIAAWSLRVREALEPTGSPAQREAVAFAADGLRRQNAEASALVASEADDDKAWLAAYQVALVAILALLFAGLAWQVMRNRRALAARNSELEARVEQRTEQLAASEARIRAVIDSALDAVVVLDRDGVIREWNPRAEQLIGVPRALVVGRPVPDGAIPPNLAASHEEALREYARGGDPGVFNARIEDVATRPDGASIPVEITAAATRSGDELTISHFVHDVTERRRARQEIEAARDAAERAASATSAFLATMSHEIRTPMNAIVGMTTLLIDTPLTREQREYVETVRTSGDALLSIINHVLDFSKIESGELELEHHPFALRDVIESALDLLAPQAAAKGLDLGYLLETDGSTRLVGDSTRLRQVLINLLSNAVKFTQAGAVTVHGRLTAAADQRARLLLEVRDTGIGIPADRLDRLFRSFSQVDASTTRRFGGTGLGLAISKRLLEAMGGDVDVRSAEGQGSTFALDVTLERVPGEDPVTADVPDDVRGRRVLVVDDNPINRQLLELQLADWALEVDALGSPQAALDHVGSGARYDLALLDIQMPEMDGLTLADRLAEAVGGYMPTVLLSSIGGVSPELARGRFAAVLSKPVKPATLRVALVEALAGGGAAAADAAQPRPAEGPRLPARPLRVLVAEDNAVNQRVAVATLERLGHLADVAADGIEAVAALRRQRYDLVLMDMQMPNLDGIGATRRIRETLAPERQPRIVAMTANAFAEDREACLRAGMDDFLTKPVQREQLLRTLAQTTPVTTAPVTTDSAQAAGDPPRPTPEDAVMDDALAAIWARVREDVLRQVGVVEDAVAALAAGTLDDATRERGRGEAHKLAGSVATFGFAAAGASARELELALADGAPAQSPAHLIELTRVLRRDLGPVEPAETGPGR